MIVVSAGLIEITVFFEASGQGALGFLNIGLMMGTVRNGFDI